MTVQSSKTILFITGAFVSHHCWDNWVSFFQSHGYNVLTPPWPFKDEDAETLRNQTPAGIAANRLATVLTYYKSIAAAQTEKPILIGHSIGGLIVQLLLQENLGAMGIAIHSVPPQGVMTFKFSFLKAGWGPLGFFTSVKKPFMMSFEQWQYAFTNGMTLEEQKAGYYALAIPESKQIVRDTITSVAKVNFKAPHAPLLFIAGSQDNTIPASLNYDNYKKYRDKGSITEYKEYPLSNHFVLGQSFWKDIAQHIMVWVSRHQA